MREQSNVLLMSPEPGVVSAVTAAMQTNGHALLPGTVRNPRELLALLGRLVVPIVLVDLDPHPRQTLAELERIIARFPTSRFVALTDDSDGELLLEAMQAGVRRIVTKPTMSAELAGALDRLMAGVTAEGGRQGTLMTILSASGGCGATTIAVNLAEELAAQQGAPSLLMDLDCSYGSLSTYLGLKPVYAVDHILNYAGPIDANLIGSTATKHSDHLHVLASPVSINFSKPERLEFNRLEQALLAARLAYRGVVVDAPRASMEVAAALAGGSTQTFLIFQLTVKDIRVASQMLQSISERGVSLGNVLPVANRCARRQDISLEDAAKALGNVAVGNVRNDYVAALQGLNFGKTLAEASPRSVLRRDVQALLAKVPAQSLE